MRGGAIGFRAWYTEGHLMTLFIGTLIVIAVASTIGAAYAWWPRSHVGAKDDRKRDAAIRH